MAANGSSRLMDGFFNLGNKATSGDPVRKAQFDYSLYWVVFVTFIGLSLNYFKTFFVTGSVGTLFWGIIIGVFCWFNYWALISFRQTYLNIKKFYGTKQTSSPKAEDAFKD